jgi:hypothetical protein
VILTISESLIPQKNNASASHIIMKKIKVFAVYVIILVQIAKQLQLPALPVLLVPNEA